MELDNDDWVVLVVRDWGLGIAEEHRAHIFDRFYQAHGVSYRSGMGLGLHISREIVALHGGDITAAFPADGGSQFTVRLMRSGVPAQAANQPERSLSMDSPADEIAAQLVRFTAELVCLLCGRMHGRLDGGSSWPPRGEALLSRPGGEQPTPVTGLVAAALHYVRRRPHRNRDHLPLGVDGSGGGLESAR